MIHPLQMYISVVFSIFTVIQPSPKSILEHFHHPKKRNTCFETNVAMKRMEVVCLLVLLLPYQKCA